MTRRVSSCSSNVLSRRISKALELVNSCETNAKVFWLSNFCIGTPVPYVGNLALYTGILALSGETLVLFCPTPPGSGKFGFVALLGHL